MRFSVTKKNFEYATSKMINIIPSKTVKPILLGTLIELKEGHVFFSATDMESAIRMNLGENFAEGEGSFVVDAKLLDEAAKNMVADEAHFIFEEGHLQFRTSSSNYDLPFMLAEDFPAIYFIEDGQTLSFPRTALLEMIENVIYACSTDELMKSLNCVLWEFEGALLRLVAADGFRLSLCEEDLFDPKEASIAEGFHFLVSLKGMKEMASYLRETREDVFQLTFDGKRICMGNETHRLLIRLMDLEFPDYRRVIPSSFKTKVTVKRDDLLKQLRFASVITRISGESVRLSVEQDQLLLFARAIDRGEADMQMSIQKEGNDLQIAFNPKFLIEAMQHFTQPVIELNFFDEASPMQINEVDVPRSINVIMPVRMS